MFVSSNIGAEQRGPGDDFWYYPVGTRNGAGLRVAPDSAMRVATVYACVSVLAKTLGQVPCILYRRLPEGGKERATDHPYYNLIHKRPNNWQTAYEWKQMLQGHLSLRGNAYCELVYTRGRVEQLVPLHPDRVRLEHLPNHNYRYRYHEVNGAERVILRGEMLHIRGLSSDGYTGISPILANADTVGEAQVAQNYTTRLLQNDARPGGVIEWDGFFKEDDDARKFRQSWQDAQTGQNRGKTAVLQKGMKFKEIGVKGSDMQLLETRKYSNYQICSLYGMPPHKVGILDRATFTNIEHQNIDFVVNTMMPWFTCWEQMLSMALIDESEGDLFYEFLADGLLRGDAKARSDFYHFGILDGWLTRNEARESENRNPLPGLDKPLEPSNMRRADEKAKSDSRDRNDRRPDPEDDDEEDDAEQAFAAAAASRVIRKEVAVIERLQRAHMGSPQTFVEKVAEFYGQHAAFVAQVMLMRADAALAYCQAQQREICGAVEHERDAMTETITPVLESWEAGRAAELVILALTNRETTA